MSYSQIHTFKLFLIGAFFFIMACNNIQDQPNISLDQIVIQDLKGEKIDIKDFLGHPLIVNYWATWCNPCINEFSDFEDIKKEQGTNASFIMISDQSLETINNFIDKTAFSFTYVKSEKQLSDYEIEVLPITYFFNSNGKLSAKHVGSIDKVKLKNYLNQLD